MSHTLYLVEFIGVPRNHHALFVRLDENERTGRLFNVTGNVQQGMVYESAPTESPEASPTFIGMTQLGRVSSADLQRIDDICRSNPPPGKQFDGTKRIDPKKPLRRCQEWTVESIQLLEAHQVLKH
ncbi:hypothetical protein QQS21_002941 [Conoideocrella luteorostrata]|uniref:Uncharacterized protein n=1 Tax=Conoideocrella luteorostrata TaxID=1105319 RepID=A0AAJ0G0X8_9HYPO|nr:hypothetical protein QQS21_002941 [Conoideocrella luteorostrata]